MTNLKRFLQLWGDFDDPYTYLVWLCIFGIWLTPTGGWQLPALFVVEVVTVGMRLWTRDVRAEQVKRKQQKEHTS